MEITTNNLITTSSSQNVSITLVNKGLPIATASADLMLTESERKEWYINRILVKHPQDRSQGIGSELLSRLKKEVKSQGGDVLIVEPGGYGSDPLDLIRFYTKNGFIRIVNWYEFKI